VKIIKMLHYTVVPKIFLRQLLYGINKKNKLIITKRKNKTGKECQFENKKLLEKEILVA
jgi:hypothetical protein